MCHVILDLPSPRSCVSPRGEEKRQSRTLEKKKQHISSWVVRFLECTHLRGIVQNKIATKKMSAVEEPEIKGWGARTGNRVFPAPSSLSVRTKQHEGAGNTDGEPRVSRLSLAEESSMFITCFCFFSSPLAPTAVVAPRHNLVFSGDSCPHMRTRAPGQKNTRTFLVRSCCSCYCLHTSKTIPTSR